MSDQKNLEEYQAVLNCDYLPWKKLSNKIIFITGGTGLVGSALIRTLLGANAQKSLGLKIYALVRSAEKARAMFSEDEALELIVGEIDPLPDIEVPVDYVVHAASPTSSQFFVDQPVETIKTAVQGTINVLDMAKTKGVQSFVYLSSMEVYGERHTDDSLTEDLPSIMRSLNVRNCYPQAKLICENLCISYFHQYALPCNVIRLAQTFGPGVPVSDNRVFAQFAKAVIGNQDIVLATAGETKRCYLYTLDAATAILTVMLKGEAGEAYNAANPATYCSILEMAKLVADRVADGAISVKVNAAGNATPGKYLPTHKWNLSADKLMTLGWKPTADLEHMYRKLIGDMCGKM